MNTHLEKWGDWRRNIQFLYLIAQQSSVQCSADFKHLVVGGLFLVARLVFCVGFLCVLVALRLLLLCRKWESLPRKKERKMNRLKKKKKRKEKSSICAVWLDVFSPLLRSVFWCTSVKCGASALAHGIRQKSQFFLAPQSQHIKTSSRSAGLLSLSVLHTLAHTMRSDPHTAL